MARLLATSILLLSWWSSGLPNAEARSLSLRFFQAQGSSLCTEVTARNVGGLYYALNPLNEQSHPQQLMAFVQTNKRLLAPNAPTIQCLRLVGLRLMNQGLASFSMKDSDHAYESALRMGADVDQARSVASSINSGSIEAYMMGEELVWLSEVVPAAAEGDWTRFAGTGTQSRLMFRQVWPLYQQMLAMDPSMRTILESAMAQMQPWVEYQVAVLAYWTGR